MHSDLVGSAPAAPSRRFGGPALAALLRLALLLCAVPVAISTPAFGQQIKILVQSSPLAGFQYHAGKQLWSRMQLGDALTLVREPDNSHDANAVRVEWQGRKIGYLPRTENRAVAAEMDRGAQVEARIARLAEDRNPWRRVLVDVYVVL